MTFVNNYAIMQTEHQIFKQIINRIKTFVSFIVAFKSHYSVPSKSNDQTGCTNTAFTVTQESNVETQRGPQIISPPPPYCEHHGDSSEKVTK